VTVTRAYRGVSAEERRGERRRRLIETALDCLHEDGLAGVSVRSVCAHAQLTPRYFYESFADLDDALLSALDEVCTEILTLATDTILATADGSAEDRVRAVVAAVVDLVVAEPAKAKVAVIHASANPQLRARRHELIGVFGDFVGREGSVMFGDQAWPPERARLQGIASIAGFAEIVAAWLSGDVELTRDELVEFGQDLFATLLRRH
jgi:AcrR family transcriptional regulator